MFSYSSIIWKKNEAPTGESLSQHSYRINVDIFKTSVKSVQGASYPRSIRYVLLRNYEEVELPWTDELGNRTETTVVYKENKETEGEQIIRYLNISKDMGSEVYILLPLENYEDGQERVRSMKANLISYTARTTLIFNGDDISKDKVKNLIQISPIHVQKNENSEIVKALQIGEKPTYNFETDENCITLKEMNLPICLDLKPYLESMDLDVSAMLGKKVPILIVGYYNDKILPQKYYCEIPLDSACFVFPEWILNLDSDKKNFLKVFIFCYPFDEFENLKDYSGKNLFCDSLNTGIYFIKKSTLLMADL